ncbi:hypothetical protein Tco_0729723 [Tanacetum coccineum]|uniref:Integrase, catalytic region, zinc finger, CCHC-type, peptidase aspartic, catalytic n=1 Tax=Tanacetum coccineum TaxID=301880 RepID=A0ABQ4YSH3_9ASTR
MSSMQEDIQCAGSDTRPPMLDRTDFESWQQRIRLYCLGKDNGENIMKSINEGPFHMGTVSDVIAGGTEGAVQQGPVRARVLNDLSAEEKERYKADIRATNILLQGIPKDIYSLINHYTDAKDIWENVKMILEGSELTKDDRESQLYDEFERFRQIKGETIQGYYVRFSKLINDMRNIKMTMSRMQLNSKFVNNMLPEWSRFITEVKLNRGLKESNKTIKTVLVKQSRTMGLGNKGVSYKGWVAIVTASTNMTQILPLKKYLLMSDLSRSTRFEYLSSTFYGSTDGMLLLQGWIIEDLESQVTHLASEVLLLTKYSSRPHRPRKLFKSLWVKKEVLLDPKQSSQLSVKRMNNLRAIQGRSQGTMLTLSRLVCLEVLTGDKEPSCMILKSFKGGYVALLDMTLNGTTEDGSCPMAQEDWGR